MSPLHRYFPPNGSGTALAALRIGGFAVRHIVALMATVACASAVGTAAYLALLVWSMVSGGGLGGLLTYPAGLLITILGGSFVCVLAFLPATAVAEWIARRRPSPLPVQIATSLLVFAVLCLLTTVITAVAAGRFAIGDIATGAALLFGIHLVPFGFYWWVARSGSLFFTLAARLLAAPKPGPEDGLNADQKDWA